MSEPGGRILRRSRRLLERRDLALRIALVAAAIALPSLWSGVACDDHHFRMVLQGFPGLPEFSQNPLDIFTFADGDASRNAAFVERGYLPWWSAPELRLAFWRPLAALTHWLDDQLWRDRPFWIHVHSLFWYTVLIVTVGFSFRRLMRPAWLAGLATVLFAVDGLHFIPIGWIASRNAMMSCTAVLLALVAHDRWRMRGGGAGAMARGPIWLAVGLLCGEAAIGLFGYLIAYELFIERGSPSRRLAGIFPYAIVALAWQIVYRQLGYGVDGSGLYLDPGSSPGEFLAVFPEHMFVLLAGLLVGPNPILWITLSPPWPTIYAWAAAVLVLLAAWIVWPLLRHDRWSRFWALGMLLSLVPGCAVVPQDRVLFVPGLGCMALVARFLHVRVVQPGRLFRDTRRAPSRVLAASLLVVHLVLPPIFSVPASYCMAWHDYQMVTVANGFPRDPSIVDEDVVIVALPSDLVLHAIPYIRSSLRWPSPRRLRALYAGVAPVEVHRPDETTLVLRSEGTFVARPWAQMFRGPNTHPFERGQTLHLSGLTIEILEVVDSKPTEVRFSFDGPLESAADHWLTWSGVELVPFELPAVGETMRLPKIHLVRVALKIIARFFESGTWRRAYRLDTGPLEADGSAVAGTLPAGTFLGSP